MRADTIAAIEANYTRLDNGNYRHNESRNVNEGPIDIGHVYGWEHRRLELAAKELNMTQKQFNDYVNAHHEHSRLDNMSRNRGHYDEMLGKDILRELKDEMQKFLDNYK